MTRGKHRPAEGGGYVARGKFYARVTVASGERRGVALPWCTSLADAQARGKALQLLVMDLRAAREETWIPNVLRVGATDDAEKFDALKRQVAAIVEGKIVPVPPKPQYAKPGEVTVEQVLEDYRAERARKGRKEATLDYYDKKFIPLVRHLPERVADVDYACLSAYVDTRLAKGVRRTSIRKELLTLKPALELARKLGKYVRIPDDVVPSVDNDYRPGTRWLEPLELVGLACVLPPHRMARVAFAVAVGCDPGAIDRARREDVREDFSGARVRGTKNKNRDRFAACPLPEQQELLRWAVAHGSGKDGLLFEPWPSVGVQLPSACRRLGVPPCSPTDCRRTYATWLRNANVSTDLIGVAMGHTGKTMVERVYGRIESDDKLLDLMRHQTTGLQPRLQPREAVTRLQESDDAAKLLFRRRDSNPNKRNQNPEEAVSNIANPADALAPSQDLSEPSASKAATAIDPVDAALAEALTEATKQGRWDVVGKVAGELEARRLARERAAVAGPGVRSVIRIHDARSKKG